MIRPPKLLFSFLVIALSLVPMRVHGQLCSDLVPDFTTPPDVDSFCSQCLDHEFPSVYGTYCGAKGDYFVGQSILGTLYECCGANNLVETLDWGSNVFIPFRLDAPGMSGSVTIRAQINVKMWGEKIGLIGNTSAWENNLYLYLKENETAPTELEILKVLRDNTNPVADGTFISVPFQVPLNENWLLRLLTGVALHTAWQRNGTTTSATARAGVEASFSGLQAVFLDVPAGATVVSPEGGPLVNNVWQPGDDHCFVAGEDRRILDMTPLECVDALQNVAEGIIINGTETMTSIDFPNLVYADSLCVTNNTSLTSISLPIASIGSDPGSVAICVNDNGDSLSVDVGGDVTGGIDIGGTGGGVTVGTGGSTGGINIVDTDGGVTVSTGGSTGGIDIGGTGGGVTVGTGGSTGGIDIVDTDGGVTVSTGGSTTSVVVDGADETSVQVGDGVTDVILGDFTAIVCGQDASISGPIPTAIADLSTCDGADRTRLVVPVGAAPVNTQFKVTRLDGLEGLQAEPGLDEISSIIGVDPVAGAHFDFGGITFSAAGSLCVDVSLDSLPPTDEAALRAALGSGLVRLAEKEDFSPWQTLPLCGLGESPTCEGCAELTLLDAAGLVTTDEATATRCVLTASVCDFSDYAMVIVDPSATSVPEGAPPRVTALGPNVPNPFNPSTSIQFTLSTRERVRLAIYDVGGRVVRVMVDEVREPDRYVSTWDGRNESGRRVSSGVYFYRLEAGEFVQVKKAVLLK